MKAQDVMTTTVVSVGPGQGTREVARILRDKGISAVPVIDDDGRPLGMVSEGDLIGRDEGDREARRDWWLNVLAEGNRFIPTSLKSASSWSPCPRCYGEAGHHRRRANNVGEIARC
jgi:CBS domain containing-hemolysin-like protein